MVRRATVAVAGAGNSAGRAARFPAGRTRRACLPARRGDLAPAMSRYLIDQIARRPGMQVLT
jgi:thioredoxin reductase